MHIPLSTYRIQLNKEFGCKELSRVLNYLHQLGISDIYASPVSKAREGSSHGYDVVEPGIVNDELGTEADFESLLVEVKKKRMGWLQDIVPNHVAFTSKNPWIKDILQNGPASRFAGYLDILWDSIPGLGNRLLVPFLGKPFGQALEDGEIALLLENDELQFSYFDHLFPMNIQSIAHFLDLIGDQEISELPAGARENIHSARLLGKNLKKRGNEQLFREELEKLLKDEAIKKLLRVAVEEVNRNDGTCKELEILLRMQHYQLAYWKSANFALNYRRFFTINDLISVQADKPEAFDDMHDLVQRYFSKGLMTGLRIDHVDGLKYPAAYLEKLSEIAPDCYLVVEKILDEGEELPDWWPVQGTTGYDYLNMLNHVFIDASQQKNFDNLYDDIAGFQKEGEDLKAAKKKLILTRNMKGDLENLVNLLLPEVQKLRFGADVMKKQLTSGLTGFLVYFPVYRTYISEGFYRDEDRQVIKNTLDIVRQKFPDMSHVFHCLEKIFTLDSILKDQQKKWVDILMRVQQLTGPLMAKGVEDTLFYAYTRLLSLNAVGGNPFSFGEGKNGFYNYLKKRMKKFPFSMNATSTHDTKRGEDVRARLNVLSEIPDEWEKKLHEWSGLNKKYRKKHSGTKVPDLHLEYSIYQTILGAYPPGEFRMNQFIERIQNYFVKFQREEKVNTSWMDPDTDREKLISEFIEEVLTSGREFLNSFHDFFRKIFFHGILNSLSQLTIKCTSPGVPDFYQGTGLWDLSLVDPDNRRPVDYSLHENFLNEIEKKEINNLNSLLQELMDEPSSGKIKLFLTKTLLNLRNQRQQLFLEGRFQPVSVKGLFKDHLVAYTRETERELILVCSPVLTTKLTAPGKYPMGNDCWKDTRLSGIPGMKMKNIITGQTLEINSDIKVGDLLRDFPVGVLVKMF